MVTRVMLLWYKTPNFLSIVEVFRKKKCFKESYKSSKMGHIIGRVAADNMAAHPRILCAAAV
jgi:hypothetical protein